MLCGPSLWLAPFVRACVLCLDTANMPCAFIVITFCLLINGTLNEERGWHMSAGGTRTKSIARKVHPQWNIHQQTPAVSKKPLHCIALHWQNLVVLLPTHCTELGMLISTIEDVSCTAALRKDGYNMTASILNS